MKLFKFFPLLLLFFMGLSVVSALSIDNNIPSEIFTYDLNLSDVLNISGSDLTLASINFTTTNQYFFYPTIDIVNWTTTGTAGSTSLQSVSYGNGRFVAVGDSGAVRYSDDGETWTTSGTAGSAALSDVTYGDSRFVAVGVSGAVRYSDDGETWTTSGTAGSSRLNGVTYGDGRFVAVGFSGAVRYSDDGETWTTSGTAGSTTLNDVTYGDGRFVAVGFSGAVRYSDDGISWTTSGTAGSTHLRGVTYGDGRFVAVGDSGAVRYSDDGISWTTSGTAGSTLWGVTYGDGRFVAVGNSGAVRYSDDGETWTTSGTAGSTTLTDVTYGDSRFVAVGFSGAVRYQDYLVISSFPSQITFTQNGLINYTIFASNSTTNITETGTILVNPLQTFRFESSLTSSILSNFIVRTSNLNYTVPGDTLQFPLYDLGLGNHTLTFEKFGFTSTDFNISFNETSLLNETFLVDPATLNLQMFDFYTGDQLSFDVNIIGNTQIFTFLNETNFTKEVSDLEPGNIEIIITKPGYSTQKYFQTLTSSNSVFITGFLTPLNFSDVVIFTVRDFNNNNPLENVNIDVQRFQNGQFQLITQAQTDSDGQTFINVDATQEYRFIFSRNGYTTAVVNSIPGVLSYNVRLKTEQQQFEFLDGVNWLFTPSASVLQANETYTFRGFISGTSLTQSTFTLTDNFGNVLYTSTSTNPTGNEFSFTYTIPTGQNITSLNSQLQYFINGKSNIVNKRYEVLEIDQTNFISLLRDYALAERTFADSLFRYLVMLIVFGSLLVLAVSFAVRTDYASITMFIPLILFTLLGWIPWVYFAILSFVLVVIWRFNNSR